MSNVVPLSIADLMENMAAAGASLDVILMAVRALEGEQRKDADRRAAVAARKRRQRAAEASERDSHGHVAGQSRDEDVTTPSLIKEGPQTPKKIKPSPGVIAHAHEASRVRSGFAAPDGVEDGLWRDFLAQRKKRITETAYARLVAKLGKLAEAGWPPGEMIGLAIERGWETVFEPKDRPNGQRNHNGQPPSIFANNPFSNPMAAAAARYLARDDAEH